MKDKTERGPRCPNHKVVLIKTDTKGVGICPSSGYSFQYKAVEGTEKRKLTTAGKIETYCEYNVEGPENG